jgi:hypothetical protein
MVDFLKLTLRFSRCLAPTWRERWKAKSFIDYSIWICRLTHSPFSHVDLLLDDGNLLGSSDNPTAPVIEGNARGVAIRQPNYQKFAVRRDVVMSVTPKEKQLFENYCRTQLGKPFDIEVMKPRIFISPNFHNRDWRTEEKWFCAELMARATEEAELLGWPIPGIKNRITPADLILLLAPLYDFELCSKPIPGLQLEQWEE